MLALAYSEAAALLRNPSDTRIGAIIAIIGQREYAVDVSSTPHHLILDFDDTEVPDADDPLQAARLGIRQREAAAIGLRLTPPTPEHARRIIDFAETLRDLDGVLLCHCLGGVSRSPAAALLCLAAWTGPGHEEYCARHLLSIRPCAQPHPDLVSFGDELLNREGALIEALRRSQRMPP